MVLRSQTGTTEAEKPASFEVLTFLIADVRGYTRFTQERGDEAAARLVAKFSHVTQEVVRSRGGRLIELRGDEALGVFPSARQALQAAIDLQARYIRETREDPSLPLPVGIGLDAGEAVPLGDGYRGDVLNLAARLCNLAGPGEILASEGVVYLGRRLPGVTYAERGLVSLKGFVDPVRVIRVVSQAPVLQGPLVTGEMHQDLAHAAQEAGAALPIGGFLGALPSGALVGRDQEWERVMSSLETVMQGSGRLVLLAGEPGIGKTRLAQELTLKARHWGFLVASGRCYEPEQAVPYYPFLEALVTVYEACPLYLRAEIPQRWPYLARLLPDQIGPLPVALAEGQEEQQRLFRAVTGMLTAIAEVMPIALLLDDLHWADDSSLKLLQHLARHTRGHRVFLLGTYRDVEVHRQHPLETILLDLGRESLVEEVEIRRLGQEGTLALMAEVMGEDEHLPPLAELIYRRTEGNAFFIQELMHALIERGDVYREGGHWELRRVKEMEVPKSVRSVIGQRLSRMDERYQEILRESSVLGQTFEFEDLVALCKLAPPTRFHLDQQVPLGWTEDEIEDALQEAVAAGLMREVNEDSYAFNHAITQQALYAELSTRRRKRLHLAAGRALERLPQRARERRAGELAWHFLEGDDADQALPYALLAGDQAERVFANGDAERHYRSALELARELDDRDREVEALEKLAGTLTVLGRYDKALELLEQAVQIHRAAGNREGERCAVAQIGQVHSLGRAPADGIARILPLVDEDADAEASYGLAALWVALARLYAGVDQIEDQLTAAEKAVALSRLVGDDRLLINAEVTRSGALWELGQDDEALRVIEALIPRAEAIGDLNVLARALGNAAIYYSRRGEFEKDRLYHERALELAERRGDRGQILSRSMSLSTNAFMVGDWPRSVVYLDRAEKILCSLGTTRLSAWPTAARGWLSLRQGNLDAARAYANESLSLAESTRDPDWRRHALRLHAEIDLLQDHPATALERLEEAKESHGWEGDAGLLRTLAWTYAELGRAGEARQAAERGVEQAQAYKDQPEVAEALTIQGMVLRRSGRYEEAEPVLSEAVALARRMPYPFGEARALQEIGELERSRGNAASGRDALQQALDIYRRLGATADTERVERLTESGTATPQ